MGSRVKSPCSAALAALCAVGLGACGRPPGAAAPSSAEASSAARILGNRTIEQPGDVALFEGVTIDRFEGDHLRHRARLASGRLDRVRGTAEGVSVRVETRDEAPTPRAIVTADRGHTQLPTKAVVLEGHVTVDDREGRTIRAEVITYDVDADTVDATGKVVFEGANFRVETEGLHFDRRSGLVDAGPAKATVRRQPSQRSRGPR